MRSGMPQVVIGLAIAQAPKASLSHEAPPGAFLSSQVIGIARGRLERLPIVGPNFPRPASRAYAALQTVVDYFYHSCIINLPVKEEGRTMGFIIVPTVFLQCYDNPLKLCLE
jgi:hypothetical protein